MRTVLQSLENTGLYLKPEKCEFHVQTTKFLAVIIPSDRISMDPAKVAMVKEWAAPASVNGIQTCLAFGNFSRPFIQGCSQVVSPVNTLSKKGIKCAWGEFLEGAFQSLKVSFTTAPILTHFDQEKASIGETDALDYV